MSDNTQQEREFAPGVFLKKKSFGKGKGEIITQAIRWAEFKEWAEQHVKEDGFLNLDIKTSKAGDKLYAELDTWVPTPREDEVPTEGQDDGLPF